MIKHVVMWNIKEGLDRDEVRQEIRRRIDALVGTVPTLISAEVGFNTNPSSAGMDICLYSVFNSKEDLHSYQVHPAHVDVKDYIGSVTKDAVVADYAI